MALRALRLSISRLTKPKFELRPVVAVTAGLATGALVAGGVQLTSAAALVPAPAVAPSAAEKVSERPDRTSAMVAAVQQHSRVEDLSARTSSSASFANPDGSWTLESYSGLVRSRSDADSWEAVDPKLDQSEPGADATPAAVPFDVEYGTGGSTDLATVTSAQGATLSLDWPTRLPAGTITDDQVTFDPSTIDDGSLVVTSHPEGFNFSVVLDSAPDSTPEYRFPLKLSQGRFVKGADGSITIKSDGMTIGTITPPVMWDSTDDAKRVPVAALLEGEGTDSAELVLRPDSAYLADPAREYPVTVDPTVALTATGDTWVQSFLVNNSQNTSPELQVGTQSGGLNQAVSYLNFDTSSLGNPQSGWIVDAKVSLSNFEAGSCSGSAVKMSQITSAWTVPGITWGTQPTVTSAGAVTNDTGKGFTGCTAEGVINFDATSIMKSWAGGATNYGVQLAAVSPGANASWRKYRSLENGDTTKAPKLTVTISQPPATPTSFTATPGLYNNFITTKTPTLSAVVSDPDGGVLKGYFEVKQGSTIIWSGTSAAVSTGGTATIDVPAGKLTEGATYTISAWGEDELNVRSTTAATKTVTVDTIAPTVSVTSAHFANDTWTNTTPSSDTTTLTGSADTGGFYLDYDGVKATIAANASGAATLDYTPTSGWHVLEVTPVDKAGNYGTPVTFSYGSGTPAFTSPNQWTPSTASFPINMSGPSSATGATLQWRVAGETTWRNATKVKKPDGSNWTGAVTGTGRSTSGALIWNASEEPFGTETLNPPALLEVKGCFQYSGAGDSCTGSLFTSLVESAFGAQFPTTRLGPADVALVSGEAVVADGDAVDSKVGISRTFATFSDSTLHAGVFGPGWSDPSVLAGQNDLSTSIIDNRDVDGTFILVGTDGGSQVFSPTGSGGTYKPLQPTGDSTKLTLVTGTPDTLVLTRPLGSGSVTITWEWRASDTGGDPGWTLKASDSPGSANDVSVVSSGQRPTFIRESDPAASSTCTPTTQTAGCRALTVTYSGTGSATRVSKIERVVGAASPAAVTTKTLASYTYTSGNLTKVCGPTPNAADPALCTEYTYTTVTGRTLLATLKPPGLTEWRFAYDSAGRMVSAKRARPAASGGGDAVWSVDYGLSLTTSGLPDMSAGKIAEWGQDLLPSKVYAVYQPFTGSASVTKATLYYTSAEGATTNTAAYGPSGWLINTNWYDASGNMVQQLDSTGWARVQAAPANARPQVAADASSYRVFNTWGGPDTVGTRLVDEYGPAITATLENGTIGSYRQHTSTVYDNDPNVDPQLIADRPGAAGLGLIVKKSFSTATADRTTDYDVSVTKYGYAPIVAGDGNGWELGSPTSTSTKVNSSTWSTSINRYDSSGRPLETRRPGGGADASGAGNDARATVTTYYSGTGSGDCGGDPEWTGLVCKVGPAVSAATSVPTRWYSNYDAELRPIEVKDYSGGAVVRSFTTSYDEIGRPTSNTVTTVGTSVGQDTITTTNGYDPATSLPTTITGTAGSSGTITTSYDAWGRQVGYTDTTGTTTTTVYDGAGRISSTDGETDSTFAYNGDGTLSTVSVSAGGTTVGDYVYTYRSDGSVATVAQPNGLSATLESNESGAPTGLSYTTTAGAPTLAFTAASDVRGRTLRRASAGSTQSFTYDGLGRLTKTEDLRASQCTTRTYGFNSSSNRTSLTTYGSASNGSCQATTASATQTYAYDSADRITNSGYSFDELGRTRTVPVGDTSVGATGALSAQYRATDMVKELSQDVSVNGVTQTKTKTYSLDPAGRVHVITSKTDGVETQRLRYRYADGTDSPSAIETSADAGSTWTSVRYGSIPGQGLAVEVAGGSVRHQISNLHGDIVATTNATGQLESYSETDEFGNAPSGAPERRYGWLGASQRSTDTLGGFLLMGARLYSPRVGSFLSADPIPDANPTPYTYPQDPVNQKDTSGMAPEKCEETDRRDPYANCERMWEACRDYASHFRCLYLFKLFKHLLEYSVRVQNGRDNNRANAGRHFSMVIISIRYVGWEAAKAIAKAHEHGVPETPDAWRDHWNNSYSLGWYQRHTDYAKDFIGWTVTKADVENLYWHGVSLYKRGYMYGVCKRGGREIKNKGTCF